MSKIPKTRTVTIRFGVFVRGSKKIFAKGLPPGCVGYQDVTFRNAPAKCDAQFAVCIMEHEDRVRNETIEVIKQEIGESDERNSGNSKRPKRSDRSPRKKAQRKRD